MTYAELLHLRELASFRGLELAQAIRMARMQLPAASPTISALVREKQLNDSALASLNQQIRSAA